MKEYSHTDFTFTDLVLIRYLHWKISEDFRKFSNFFEILRKFMEFAPEKIFFALKFNIFWGVNHFGD